MLSVQFHLIPAGVKLQRALMVQQMWANLLITGEKTLELRNYNCRNVKVGEEVELIACGQGPCGVVSFSLLANMFTVYMVLLEIHRKDSFRGHVNITFNDCSCICLFIMHHCLSRSMRVTKVL